MSESYCGDNLPTVLSEFHFQEELFEDPVSAPIFVTDTRSPLEIINSDFKIFANFVKFGHINAVTVPGNRDEIQRTLMEIGFDIFAVTETNIHKKYSKMCV